MHTYTIIARLGFLGKFVLSAYALSQAGLATPFFIVDPAPVTVVTAVAISGAHDAA